MKTNIKYALLFIIVISLAKCKCNKDDDPKPEYTVTGTYYSACNGSVLSNTTIVLYQMQVATISGVQSAQSYSATTDANGRFSIKYTKPDADAPLILQDASSARIEGIPSKQNIDLGNVYKTNKANIYMKIKFATPHSSSDTLYYSIRFAMTAKTIAGSFPSNFYDSVMLYRGTLSGGYANYNTPETGQMLWGLGYSDYQMSLASISPSVADYHIVTFNYRGCGYKDSVFVNVP